MTGRIVFGHPLHGAELRLARARRLIGTLDRQYTRWANEHQEHRHELDRVAGRVNVSPVIPDTKEIHLPRMSITVGEIAYNVRAALDYLIYSIARAGNNGKELDGTQFPLEDRPDRYWMRWTGIDPKTHKDIASSAHWLKGIPKDVAEDLSHYQPWKCGWTKLLRDISNRDKHRHLHTLTTTARPHIDGTVLSVIDTNKRQQTIHFRNRLEVGVFLPTGEDVIDATHLVESEARALIRSYARIFQMPPPGIVQDELPIQRRSRP